METGKRQPYPRREPQKGMGAGKHLSYPRRELRKGTGARNLPLYPERKREELNVENADGLKKLVGRQTMPYTGTERNIDK